MNIKFFVITDENLSTDYLDVDKVINRVSITLDYLYIHLDKYSFCINELYNEPDVLYCAIKECEKEENTLPVIVLIRWDNIDDCRSNPDLLRVIYTYYLYPTFTDIFYKYYMSYAYGDLWELDTSFKLLCELCDYE